MALPDTRRGRRLPLAQHTEPASAPMIAGAGLTRRSFLAGATALGAAPATLLRPARAAGLPVPFGGAIQSDLFDGDPAYPKAFLDHCDIILPMNELKLFSMLRPDAETFDFAPADRLVDFALSNGKRSRGHTHVWWNAIPDWLQAITDPAKAEAALARHIDTVMAHYRGRLESWDVVNEVIAHEPTADAPLRDSYWLRTMGPRHIPVAFAAAARADPGARLVLNDYDLEFRGDRYELRRAIALSIVRQLQDASLRIDAVGIQAHLYAELEIDIEAVARFGRDLKALGVSLIVTELDVIDWKIRGGAKKQDAAALAIVSDLLDGVFDAGPPDAVICWGITDKYSWIPDVMPHRDGTPSRPLPLDSEYRPKPWYDLIRKRLRS